MNTPIYEDLYVESVIHSAFDARCSMCQHPWHGLPCIKDSGMCKCPGPWGES